LKKIKKNLACQIACLLEAIKDKSTKAIFEFLNKYFCGKISQAIDFSV